MLLFMKDSARMMGLLRMSIGVVLLGTAVALSGCATMTGGVPGDVSRSMSDAASASQSAALAFQQNLDDRATDAVTGTTLDDMLDEVQTAATSLAELDTSTLQEAALRKEATSAIRDCTDSITDARDVLSGAAGATGSENDPAPGALEHLQSAADRATALSEELEKYR
jgi:hypothetical protein